MHHGAGAVTGSFAGGSPDAGIVSVCRQFSRTLVSALEQVGKHADDARVRWADAGSGGICGSGTLGGYNVAGQLLAQAASSNVGAISISARSQFGAGLLAEPDAGMIEQNRVCGLEITDAQACKRRPSARDWLALGLMTRAQELALEASIKAAGDRRKEAEIADIAVNKNDHLACAQQNAANAAGNAAGNMNRFADAQCSAGDAAVTAAGQHDRNAEAVNKEADAKLRLQGITPVEDKGQLQERRHQRHQGRLGCVIN